MACQGDISFTYDKKKTARVWCMKFSMYSTPYRFYRNLKTNEMKKVFDNLFLYNMKVTIYCSKSTINCHMFEQ